MSLAHGPVVRPAHRLSHLPDREVQQYDGDAVGFFDTAGSGTTSKRSSR